MNRCKCLICWAAESPCGREPLEGQDRCDICEEWTLAENSPHRLAWYPVEKRGESP